LSSIIWFKCYLISHRHVGTISRDWKMNVRFRLNFHRRRSAQICEKFGTGGLVTLKEIQVGLLLQ
jgi:hypothetical protein